MDLEKSLKLSLGSMVVKWWCGLQWLNGLISDSGGAEVGGGLDLGLKCIYLQSLTDQWISIRSMGLKFLGLFTGFSNLGLKFMGLMFVWRV